MGSGTVLVTGASTGIGRATVERLAADGYQVIAGVRRAQDAPPAAVAHVLIDLADESTIGPAAHEAQSQAAGKLVGLVNNAGVNVNGPFEVLPIGEWRRQFEVNFFGHLTLTHHLLPTLLQTKGRIVTVGSVGGRFSAPFLGPYSASKFAIRAWMDALRIEVGPHGVKAILIEPGAIRTEMWGKGNAHADATLAGMTSEQGRHYARQVDGARKTAAFAEAHAIPADKAAGVIAHALSARNPRGRYLVGADARVQALVAAAPTRTSDRLLRLLLRQPRRV